MIKKVYISEDEAYPVYSISPHDYCGLEVEVEEKILRKWARVEIKYRKMQREMCLYFTLAIDARQARDRRAEKENGKKLNFLDLPID